MLLCRSQVVVRCAPKKEWGALLRRSAQAVDATCCARQPVRLQVASCSTNAPCGLASRRKHTVARDCMARTTARHERNMFALNHVRSSVSSLLPIPRLPLGVVGDTWRARCTGLTRGFNDFASSPLPVDVSDAVEEPPSSSEAPVSESVELPTDSADPAEHDSDVAKAVEDLDQLCNSQSLSRREFTRVKNRVAGVLRAKGHKVYNSAKLHELLIVGAVRTKSTRDLRAHFRALDNAAFPLQLTAALLDRCVFSLTSFPGLFLGTTDRPLITSLYEQAQKFDVVPTVRFMTAVAKTLALDGRKEEFNEVVERLLGGDYTLDATVMGVITIGYGRLRDVAGVSAMMERVMGSSFKHEHYMHRVLVTALGMCDSTHKIESLLELLRKDRLDQAETYAAVSSVYARLGKVDRVREIFEFVVKRKRKGTSAMLVTCIGACSSLHERVLMFFEMCCPNLPLPDVYKHPLDLPQMSYQPLFSVYFELVPMLIDMKASRSTELEAKSDAVRVESEFAAKALAKELGCAGPSRRSIDIVGPRQRLGYADLPLLPARFVFHAMLKHLAEAGDWKAFTVVLDYMKTTSNVHVKANEETYDRVAQIYLREHDYETCLGLVERMWEWGFMASSVTLNELRVHNLKDEAVLRRLWAIVDGYQLDKLPHRTQRAMRSVQACCSTALVELGVNPATLSAPAKAGSVGVRAAHEAGTS